MGFIELKVMSCKQVTAFNFFQKLSIYVSVSIISDGNAKRNDQRQRTSTDTEGDGNPEWNQEMRFDLEEDGGKLDGIFIHFEIRHEGIMFGDKTIGEVRVPVKEMVEESRGGIVRFVSYQIRDSEGKANGILNFSYMAVLVDNGNGKPSDNSCCYGDMISSSSSDYHIDNNNTNKIAYPRVEVGSSLLTMAENNYQTTYNSGSGPYPSPAYYPSPPVMYGACCYPPPPPPPRPPPPQWTTSSSPSYGGYFEYYNNHLQSNGCGHGHGHGHPDPWSWNGNPR